MIKYATYKVVQCSLCKERIEERVDDLKGINVPELKKTGCQHKWVEIKDEKTRQL